METNNNPLENPQSDKPLFNMGLAYLIRLDKLLSMATKYSIIGDTILWHRTLKALYRDVSKYLDNTEKETILKALGEVILISNPRNVTESQKMSKSYNDMDVIDEYLRRLIHEKGLIMPNKDNPGLAILG